MKKILVFLSLSLSLSFSPQLTFADNNTNIFAPDTTISLLAEEFQDIFDSQDVITNSKEISMRPASILVSSVTIALLCGSTLGFASHLEKVLAPTTELIIEKDKLFDPNHLSFDSMQMYEKKFNFDWNNIIATMEPNKNKISDIENFIKITKSEEYAKLKNADRQIIGKILFKLATYYTHITREPKLAIERMNLADMFLQNRQDKIWIYNHLAYAYEQKYAASKNEADKKRATTYIDNVILLNHDAKNREVAFAYCMQGLLHNDDKNFGLAESSFKSALQIYEKIPNGKDEQYARAKNRLATIMLDENGHDQEAIKILKDLKQYWIAKGHINQNPYAARNLISLGRAYLKIRNDKYAQNELINAIKIYQSISSNKELLKPVYQLLAETYRNLGDKKQAESYLQKASMISRE